MADMILTLRIDAEQLKRGVVEVKGKLSELTGKPVDVNTRPAEDKIRGLRDSVAMWGLAIQGAIAAFNMVGRALDSVIKPAIEAEAGITKIRAAVESTGGAAGYTAGELSRMAGEMQKAFSVDDDQIMNELTAPLLTFTNITGDAFARAQEAALDLSVVMGGDLQGAALQLGKALNDPTQGLTALRRSGVSFSDVQIEMIKGLWEAGQAGQAQAIILDELNKQFGGQAAAYAESYAGRMNALKLAWGDMAQSVGELLLPVLSNLSDILRPLIEWFTSLSGPIKALIVLTPILAAGWYKLMVSQIAYTTATGALTGALTAAKVAVQTFITTMGPVGLGITLISGMIASLAGLFTRAENASRALTAEQDRGRQEALKQSATFDMLATTYERLRSNTSRTEHENNMLAYSIQRLKDLAPEHLRNLDLEKGKYEDIAAALAIVKSNLEAKINLAAQDAIIEQASQSLGKLMEFRNYLSGSAEDRQLMRFLNPALAQYERMATSGGRSREATIAGINRMINEISGRTTSLVSRLPGAGAGGGGGAGAGGGGGGAANTVLDEWARTAAEIEALNRSELQKMELAYQQYINNINANTEEGSEERARLTAEADSWIEAQRAEHQARIDEAERNANEARNKKIAAYYDEVKFMDASYFQWKSGKIAEEVQALELSQLQKNELLTQRLAELSREKAAWDAMPIAGVIERYQQFKNEMAEAREIGIASWADIRDGLIGYRDELQAYADDPKVALILARIQNEIDIAQMNAGSKKGSWFWSGLLGFDPDSEADRAKISKYQQAYRDLMGMGEQTLSSMLSLSNQRRDAELARIDEVAAREKWSDGETLKRKENITKRYEAEERKLKRIQKALAIGSATINVAEGVTKALALGPVIGPIMAAVVSALGAVQIGIIGAQKFARGGLFQGAGTGLSDSNLAYISNGEYIVNAAATAANRPMLDAINYGRGDIFTMIARKLDALNMNVAALDMQVGVYVNAPDVEARVERHERVKAQMQSRGKGFTYAV